MKKNSRHILSISIAVSALVSVSLLWRHEYIVLMILIVLAILMLLINKSKREVMTFIFCGLLGALAEAFAIIFGAWTYGNPNFIGIPIWLFVLWGIASVFMGRVYVSFKD